MKITLLSKKEAMMIAIASCVVMGTAAAAAQNNLRGPAATQLEQQQGSRVASFPFFSSSSSKMMLSSSSSGRHVSSSSSSSSSRQLSEEEQPGSWVWKQVWPSGLDDLHDIGCGEAIYAIKGPDDSSSGVYIFENPYRYPWPPSFWPIGNDDSTSMEGVKNVDHSLNRLVTADGNGNLYEYNFQDDDSTTTAEDEWALVPDIYATDVGLSMSFLAPGRLCVIGENLPEKEGNGFIYCESLSTPGEFEKLPGHGVRIAVKSNGYPVVVNTQGDLWSFHGSHWNQTANSYKYIDVAVGPDDVIWAVTADNEVVAILDTSINLDYGIVDLDTTTVFPIINSPPGANHISVDSEGNVWTVTAPNGGLYRGMPQDFLGCGGNPNDVWYSAISGCSPSSSQWRIRNAEEPSGNAWALRGLRFCKDLNCNDIATGEVIDDGSAPEWGSASSLFNNDTADFWKSFNGNEKGKAFAGLKLDEPTHISAVGIRPDNVVYGISEVYVEYLDDKTGKWTTFKTLKNVPKHYADIGSGGPTYKNDVWYTAALN